MPVSRTFQTPRRSHGLCTPLNPGIHLRLARSGRLWVGCSRSPPADASPEKSASSSCQLGQKNASGLCLTGLLRVEF